MPKDINIDEEDATFCGRFAIPFVALIILSLLVEQYWQNLDWNVQLAVILFLGLAATFVYRDKIREMIYN